MSFYHPTMVERGMRLIYPPPILWGQLNQEHDIITLKRSIETLLDSSWELLGLLVTPPPRSLKKRKNIYHYHYQPIREESWFPINSPRHFFIETTRPTWILQSYFPENLCLPSPTDHAFAPSQ